MTKTPCAAISPIVSILLPIALFLTGCDRRDRDIRSYREVQYRTASATDPATPAPAAAANAMTGSVPTAGMALAWVVPDGWTAQPDRPMRVATFLAGEVECSVTAFPGDTGGEEANLRRWLGQMNVTPDSAVLQALTAAATTFETASGWKGRAFDLSSAAGPQSSGGMRAAIIPADGQTVFVKLTGPRVALDAQSENLLSFCRSLKPRR